MRYVDLSHTIDQGVVTYRGLPAPLICDFLSREASREHYDGDTTFQIGRIDMVGNTGTYIDCPFHRYAEGKDFTEIFLSSVVDLPGVRVSVPWTDSMAVDRQHFMGLDLKGKAVLVHTGWAAKWNTDAYFENHPFVTAEAADYLMEQEIALLGIDAHNVDDTRRNSRPVHSTLLAQNILIVEHLCQLHLIPDQNFLFSAVPPRIKGIGSFPVRAYAKF